MSFVIKPDLVEFNSSIRESLPKEHWSKKNAAASRKKEELAQSKSNSYTQQQHVETPIH